MTDNRAVTQGNTVWISTPYSATTSGYVYTGTGTSNRGAIPRPYVEIDREWILNREPTYYPLDDPASVREAIEALERVQNRHFTKEEQVEEAPEEDISIEELLGY